MEDAPERSHDEAETRRHLEGYLESYPGLRGRVCRVLLLHMHTLGLIKIEEVYRRAERAEEWQAPQDPNRPSARLWAADEKETINSIVIELAAQHLSPKEVDEIVWAAHRRDEAQSLEVLARMPDVPLELIADKVSQYASIPVSVDDPKVSSTPTGTKVALIRRFVSDKVDYISVAKRHLYVRDISWVLDRVVGTERGSGTVGGKAAGMLLAWAILRSQGAGDIEMPDTVFVLTDAYQEFKDINGLSYLADHKYRPIKEIRADFRAIREVFRNAEFPARIVDLLRAELHRWGEVPLIVRSSSVLEDSFGAAFSGIYHSLFLPNRGGQEERLRELVGAIAEIYAGVFSADAIYYRSRHGLLDHDERMGVMIQPVVGRRHGRYFHPDMAGVAFSRNDYRWSRRIRREDGMVRLVLGLGTHAVDRVGDSARLVPLGAPDIRPEGTSEEILNASQKQADVVDLEGRGFTSVPVGEVLDVMRPAGISDYVSIIEPDGRLTQPVVTRILEPADRLCVTFDRLLAKGEFPKRMTAVLEALERAYRVPVDFEFAVNDGHLYVLQCRPLGSSILTARIPVPRDVPVEDRVFSARRYVNNGFLEEIDYLVLVDPRDYGRISSVDKRLEVARTVGHVNDALAEKSFVLMGPGRWGSQNIQLGIQVGFGDICNARALIEIARKAEGYTPEPSFGTHFFQELIEASILYLPLYPDDEGVIFNEDFLIRSPNCLGRVCPDDEHMSEFVRVIDASEASRGRTLLLVMDGELQEALCYMR
ncbi:MAG: PEP/pyruvate-binding domain-containing protein [Planctomycetota bacterium]|jgi:hypothetical protein